MSTRAGVQRNLRARRSTFSLVTPNGFLASFAGLRSATRTWGGNTIPPQRIPCRSNGVINSVHWLFPALLPLKWTTRPSFPPRLTLRPTLRFSSPPGHLRDASSRLRLCRHALCPLTTLTPIDIHICLNLPTGRKRCTIKSVSHEVPGKEIAGHLPFLAPPPRSS